MPKIGMNAPTSLMNGMPALNTPTAALRIDATSHSREQRGARRSATPEHAIAEIERREPDEPTQATISAMCYMAPPFCAP